MKNIDFRIGNLLHDREGRLCKVYQIDKDGFSACAITGPITSLPYSPIEFSVELATKLGFLVEVLNYGCFEFEVNNFYSLQYQPKDNHNEKSGWHLFVNGRKYDSGTFIEYVHEFQNLVYALTGKEI